MNPKVELNMPFSPLQGYRIAVWNASGEITCPGTGIRIENPVILENMVCHHMHDRAGLDKLLHTGWQARPVSGCANKDLSLDQVEEEKLKQIKMIEDEKMRMPLGCWKRAGADIIHMSDVTSATSYEDFEVWWDKEVQRATKDMVALVVVDANDIIGSQWHSWLKRKEEADFDGEEDDSRMRITTMDNIHEAFMSNKKLRDTWGDIVEKPRKKRSLLAGFESLRIAHDNTPNKLKGIKRGVLDVGTED